MLSLIFCGCQETDPHTLPFGSVETISVEVEPNLVTFEALIVNNDQVIIDHGFVYDQFVADLSHGHVISLGPESDPLFRAQTSHNLINNKEYTVKAYVQTADYTTYGNEITFISKGGLPHIITDFTPKSGVIGDIITITGEYFSVSTSDLNAVLIGGTVSEKTFSSTGEIRVKVNAVLLPGEHNVEMQNGDHLVIADGKFELKALNISGISGIEMNFTDELILTGENFGPASESRVNLLGITAEILSANSNSLSFKLPSFVSSTSSEVELKVGAQVVQTGFTVSLKAPDVQSVTPNSVSENDIITITGGNFNPSGQGMSITLDGEELEIVTIDPNEITARIPSGISPGTYPVLVNLYDLEDQSLDLVTVN